MSPWVSYHRDRLSENGDVHGHLWMDCNECQKWLRPSARASWRCGLMPSKSWTSETTPAPWLKYADQDEPTVCVGYTTSLPAVREATRAYVWAERGLLREFYDDEPLGPNVFDAVDFYTSAIRSVERFVYREQKARTDAAAARRKLK